jgi:hypothetical protein
MTEEQSPFDPAEERALRECLSRGDTPVCPRCGVAMTMRGVGGGSFGLGYARRRQWLICPRCRRSALFDLGRGTRT